MIAVVDDKVIESETLPLRPNNFDDFIGQEAIKKNLLTFINATKLRNKPLDHVLISGPPGLGKTTLSSIIANELGCKITSTSAPLLDKQGDLAAVLTSLEPNQILFIDEIHRLNRNIEEVLYSSMEDYKLDVIVGQGPSVRTVKIDLPNFTLIGATTRLGMISAPLRDRFGIPIRLDFYDTNNLILILLRSARVLKIDISQAAANEIASRSRGTPRIANRYLKRCHDYAIVAGHGIIEKEDVLIALKELDIDTNGLDQLDIKYLKILIGSHNHQPLGLSTLALALSEDKDTIELALEPYLVRLGLIKKTLRGRILTASGYEYLNINRPYIPVNLF